MEREDGPQDVATEPTALSRRRLIGATAMAAGGTIAAGTIIGSADVAAGNDGIATGTSGTIAMEIVAEIHQQAQEFVAVGYATSISGLQYSDLGFTDPLNSSEANALFTIKATGVVVARAAKPGAPPPAAVFSLDVNGTLDIYLRQTPGATFTDPNTFIAGTKVATFDLVLQDVLTVIATNTGIPTLSGVATQTFAARSRGTTFGSRGQQLRLEATGVGNRTDPAPIATLSIAGNLTII